MDGITNRESGFARSCWYLVGCLLLANFALNMAYLLSEPPLELAADEAHYWEWSKNLDWSYYSKGPLVAWLMWLSDTAYHTLGGEEFGPRVVAVRLPAPICQLIILASVALLMARVFPKPQQAVFGVVGLLALPGVAALGTVMTIDAPFLACWALAMVATHSALFREGGWTAWTLAGVACLFGVLAKYTMVMLPGCLMAWFLFDSRQRWRLGSLGPWLLPVGIFLGMIPIVYWNAANDWVSFRHVLTQAGGSVAPGKPKWKPFGPLEMIGTQCLLLLGVWFAAYISALWQHRPTNRPSSENSFLWWLSVPIVVFFFVISVRSKVQPNWTAPAYLTGWLLAFGQFCHWYESASETGRRRLLVLALFASVCGLFGTGLARYPGLMRPYLSRLVPEPELVRPTPVRQLDPTSRLFGWKALAERVDQLREQVRLEEGREPEIAGMSWILPGQLKFYCEGNPRVYSFGTALLDRHSQLDLWRPNPLADAQEFAGRTFIYVGAGWPGMYEVFDRVEPPVEVLASDGGVPVAHWYVWVCRGYRGFPAGSIEAGSRY